MTVPLKDDAGVFGTLSVYASEVDAFHTEEDRVICELASDVSFGIGSLFAQRFAEEHAALKGKGAAERLDPMAKLSQREREVLELVVQGKSSKQIAHHLGIAPASVDTYRSRIMTKLAIDDITGLVRFAIRHGLVQP
jgi:DNA-binding NarL/FixJ family response regulator